MVSAEGGLPTGTVTFLFTDLEGSTRLWEERTERSCHSVSAAYRSASVKERGRVNR
jgi:class 3 adenylate cyclase